jgi:hypothetical protein
MVRDESLAAFEIGFVRVLSAEIVWHPDSGLASRLPMRLQSPKLIASQRP